MNLNLEDNFTIHHFPPSLDFLVKLHLNANSVIDALYLKV